MKTNTRSRSLAALALFGFVGADHAQCNFKQQIFNTDDCSGSPYSNDALSDMTEIGECGNWMGTKGTDYHSTVRFTECSSTRVKFDVFDNDDCSGSGGALTWEVGKCSKVGSIS